MGDCGGVSPLLANHDLLLVVDVNQSRVTITDPSAEEFFSERIFEQAHHGPTQRPSAIGGVVALIHKPFLERLGDREGDALLQHPSEDLLEHDLGDLLNLIAG